MRPVEYVPPDRVSFFLRGLPSGRNIIIVLDQTGFYGFLWISFETCFQLDPTDTIYFQISLTIRWYDLAIKKFRIFAASGIV